jgi:hypothetical protein
MAKEKKTIQIEMIKNFANEQLAHPNTFMEEKLGIITMIEKILLEANAYKGFMFLHLDENNNPPSLGTDEYVTRKYF